MPVAASSGVIARGATNQGVRMAWCGVRHRYRLPNGGSTIESEPGNAPNRSHSVSMLARCIQEAAESRRSRSIVNVGEPV